jgi:hypothetical protein
MYLVGSVGFKDLRWDPILRRQGKVPFMVAVFAVLVFDSRLSFVSSVLFRQADLLCLQSDRSVCSGMQCALNRHGKIGAVFFVVPGIIGGLVPWRYLWHVFFCLLDFGKSIALDRRWRFPGTSEVSIPWWYRCCPILLMKGVVVLGVGVKRSDLEAT